tara:strand:+ start:797 stop:1066 length:270 start_codon:yes stop_codon:yes gene_type:complete
MKALISSTEISDVTWISSWTYDEVTKTYEPYYSGIENTMRVAEVVADDATFEVYETLFWVDCPDDCEADTWYYKDGSVYIKPEDVPKPE